MMTEEVHWLTKDSWLVCVAWFWDSELVSGFLKRSCGWREGFQSACARPASMIARGEDHSAPWAASCREQTACVAKKDEPGMNGDLVLKPSQELGVTTQGLFMRNLTTEMALSVTGGSWADMGSGKRVASATQHCCSS
jgi:uncharacterized protein YrrD